MSDAYDGWTVADEGIVEGVQYVTVLTSGGDPYEYEITAEQARQGYGLTLATHPYQEAP